MTVADFRFGMMMAEVCFVAMFRCCVYVCGLRGGSAVVNPISDKKLCYVCVVCRVVCSSISPVLLLFVRVRKGYFQGYVHHVVLSNCLCKINVCLLVLQGNL